MDEPRLKCAVLTDSFQYGIDSDRFGLDPFPIRRSIYSNGSMTRHPFTILSILRCFEYTESFYIPNEEYKDGQTRKGRQETMR